MNKDNCSKIPIRVVLFCTLALGYVAMGSAWQCGALSNLLLFLLSDMATVPQPVVIHILTKSWA